MWCEGLCAANGCPMSCAMHQNGGWAHLGAVGSYLSKIRPDFDPRLYGHKKLSDLLKAHKALFDVQERDSAGGSKTILVRLKA